LRFLWVRTYEARERFKYLLNYYSLMKNKKKYILIGYRHPSIKLYTPKRNKTKLAILFGFVGLCLSLHSQIG